VKALYTTDTWGSSSSVVKLWIKYFQPQKNRHRKDIGKICRIRENLPDKSTRVILTGCTRMHTYIRTYLQVCGWEPGQILVKAKQWKSQRSGGRAQTSWENVYRECGQSCRIFIFALQFVLLSVTTSQPSSTVLYEFRAWSWELHRRIGNGITFLQETLRSVVGIRNTGLLMLSLQRFRPAWNS
jgi:hypothetical protein